MGVHETSFQSRNEYVKVVSDVARGRVVNVAGGGGQEALESLYRGLTEPQHLSIDAVAMELKSARARVIKAMARDLLSYADRGWARRGWRRWLD